MPEIDSSGNRKLLATVIAVLVIGYAIYSSGLIKQSIAPGFQGVSSSVWGYQVGQNPSTALGASLPNRSPACSYAWNNYAASGYSVTVTTPNQWNFLSTCYVGTATDTLYVQAQGNVVPASLLLATPISGSYSVAVPNSPGQYEQVAFQVNVYTYNVNVGINSGANGFNFGGDTVWLSLTDNVWDQVGAAGGASNCVPSQATAQGQCVFEAPLFGQVTNFQTQDWGGNNCVQCTNGAALTFYTTPSASNAVSTSSAPSQQSIQNQLGSAYAPDSRMVRQVYYPISLQQFAAICGIGSSITGCNGIQASFTITLYTLQIGEYITSSQNPSQTGLGSNPTGTCAGLQCTLNAIGACFSLTNLFCWGSIAALGTTAIIVLVLIFAGPTVVALFLLARKKESTG